MELDACASNQPASSSADKIICNGCKLTLEENGTASDSVVVSFGNSLWHVDCFRCAKCRNLVEHDTNLLLLSDGSPVCENCSYICSVCKHPISNEAIVTGEESYHADCFRCRSCSNRIEELIFAKTSQGIYCMTCHNERVTRSRRHAEAKRNKSSITNQSSHHKKDRDKDRYQNSSNLRSKSKTPLPSQPPSSSSHSTFNLPPPSSTTGPSLSNSTPNLSDFPSPIDPSKSLSSLPNTPYTPNPPLNKRFSSNSLLNSYLNHQPELASSRASAALSALQSNTLDQTLPTLQTSRSASHVAAGRRRGGSASSVHLPPTGQLAGSRAHDPPNLRLQGLAQFAIPRPSSADGKSSSTSPLHSHPTSVNRSHDSSPQLPANISHTKSDLRSDHVGINSIDAPKDEQADSKIRIKHRSVSLSSFDGINIQNALQALSSQSPLSSDVERNLSAFDSTSFSFQASLGHDPDNHLTPLEDRSRLMSQLELSAIDLETLLATPTAQESPDQRVTASDEITNKVRESISQNRERPNSVSELGLDVGLVERLLWELDGTKEKMKALQDEYHQMRRFSRSAYEGVSLAKQKYESQVIQREIAEAKMKELKLRMIEQASRLKEMDSLTTLECQSEELRDSLSNLQKQLSQLVADRDLRIAELGVLDEIRDQAKKGGELASSEILSERLDQLRHRYLEDIQGLVGERDKLKEEVAHLSKIRESQAKELASLNHRQDALTEMNATAVKQLEETKTSASRLLGRHAGLASTAKPVFQPATTLPIQSISQESDLPIQMSPEVNIATTRKFKWGKSHTHKASMASRQHHAKNRSSISTPESIGINNPSGGAGTSDPTNNATNIHTPSNSSNGNLPSTHSNGPGAHNNSSPAPNSVVGLRPHSFQPVSALRPVRCDYCGDKLWGLAEVRCTACGSYSHTKCAPNFFGCHVSNGNLGQSYTVSSSVLYGAANNEEDVEGALFGNDLVAQAKAENKLVPSVVIKCIEAVEEQGLKFEGIYRKTGGMSSVKMIQNCFERGQSMDFNDLDKFNDISAITSTLKNYFRQLPNPLFTFELHEAFVTVASKFCPQRAMAQENIRLEALERVIHQLPAVHFETLKVLMNHLSRIEKQSEHNKMTSQNLGVIFGPTLLRSSNPNRQFSDMPFTAKIVELTVLNRAQLFRRPFGSLPPPTTPGSHSSGSHQHLTSNPPSNISHLSHSSSASNSNIQLQPSSASSSSASNISCTPQSSSHLIA
ncbi:hypothetical protein VP01_476g1 [Puccinia sorghi]|uniref:Signal transducer n=1 Tax=Puccinia sorghi TaxID=27349 RepID=A0A0L6UNG1_9BASI|nr:hypothetical protein VP01_476g1 [Puccinia sorghi]